MYNVYTTTSNTYPYRTESTTSGYSVSTTNVNTPNGYNPQY